MYVVKKVKTLEVKRCFVVSQLVRKQKIHKSSFKSLSLRARKRFLKSVSLIEFKQKLQLAKKKVFNMREKELDRLIRKEYRKRFLAFNNSNWYIGEVTPAEVGVWRRAGNLPLDWTIGSLKETAKQVENAINTSSKRLIGRAKHAVLNILRINVSFIQNERYLLPIIFQGCTGTKGRKRLKNKTKYDIDDGCMRSIALTIHGAKKIK